MQSVPAAGSSPAHSNLGEAFAYAGKCGWNAARQMLLPAGIIQGLMFLMVIGYYRHWQSTIILTTISKGQQKSEEFVRFGAAFYDFITTGLAAGVMAEIFKVYCVQKGRWTSGNLRDAFFKFFIIGGGGFVAGIFYSIQGKMFGTHVSFQAVLEKVCVDQFILSPLIVAPFPCLLNHCLEKGFSLQALSECLSLEFYVRRILPLQLATWCFWFPMSTLIYSLPFLLQFPLFLCSSTIWGLIFVSLIKQPQSE